jgi:hypothetical protein
MESRNQDVRKGGEDDEQPRQPKLPVRTGVVLALAGLTALAAAGLMCLGGLAVPLIVVGATGSLVTSYGFWDSVIE